MLNPKTHQPMPPVKQRDVDICSALMGLPLGQMSPQELHREPEPEAPAQPIELAQLFVLPKTKQEMRTFVKQVQSRVVQVSGTMKDRMVVAGGQVREKVSVLNEQVKQRMAESAAATAKRMKKAS